jgi:hypothetical protein
MFDPRQIGRDNRSVFKTLLDHSLVKWRFRKLRRKPLASKIVEAFK